MSRLVSFKYYQILLFSRKHTRILPLLIIDVNIKETNMKERSHATTEIFKIYYILINTNITKDIKIVSEKINITHKNQYEKIRQFLYYEVMRKLLFLQPRLKY